MAHGADAADDDDEQRPAQHRVDDDRRRSEGQIPNASTPMPRMAMAGGTRFTPASSRVVRLTPACWLAAPSQAKTPAATPLARSTTTATTSLPPSHDARETGRTRRWSSRPLGLLGTRRGELAGGDEGHQDGQDEEAHAEHGVGAGPRRAELGEHLLDRRPRDRGAGRLGDEPVQQRRHGDGHPPADDRGPHQPDGQPVGPESSRRCGSLVARSGRMLAPTSREPARRTATTASTRGEGDDRHEGQRLGRGEGSELLDPAERRGPDQSVQAHAGVGDHPHGVGDAEEDRGVGGGLAPGRRRVGW